MSQTQHLVLSSSSEEDSSELIRLLMSRQKPEGPGVVSGMAFCLDIVLVLGFPPDLCLLFVGALLMLMGVSEVVQNELTPKQFLAVKLKVLTENKPQTKKRKYLSTIISGKPVTEDHMVSAIKAHEANRKPRSKTQSQKPKSTGKSPTNSKHKSGGKP